MFLLLGEQPLHGKETGSTGPFSDLALKARRELRTGTDAPITVVESLFLNALQHKGLLLVFVWAAIGTLQSSTSFLPRAPQSLSFTGRPSLTTLCGRTPSGSFSLLSSSLTRRFCHFAVPTPTNKNPTYEPEGLLMGPCLRQQQLVRR